MNVLISSPLLINYKDRFESLVKDIIWVPDENPTDEQINNADIIIGKIKSERLVNTTKLKYYHILFAGSDVFVSNHLKEIGTLASNSTGCFSQSIAEYMLSASLFFLKDIGTYRDKQRKHEWVLNTSVKTMYDQNVLVVGCGSIGMTYAKMANALGAHVTGLKRTPGNKPEYLEGLYTIDKLDELLPNADIITLSMPQSDQTKGMFNKERLAKIKKGAIVINVGRGTVFEEDALIEALKENRFNAMLDVFPKEPLDKNSPLWDLDNVQIIPHATGTTNNPHTTKLVVDLAYDNLKAFLNNQPVKNVVDYNTGYKVSNS